MIVGNNCINSFPDGCDDLKVSVTKMINVLIIAKTKIDATFPVSYFHIDGFSEPYRLGKSRNFYKIFLTIKHFGSTFNYFFLRKEKFQRKLL